MFYDYKKKQEELNNIEKCALAEYEVAKACLSDYIEDLEKLTEKFNSDREALKLKHDYNSKAEIRAKAHKRLCDAQINNKYAKILFILDVIYNLLEHPFYKNSEYGVWNFLYNEWDIQHEDYYYSFQEMYELIKREGLDTVTVYCPSELNQRDTYEISHTKYFRGETDECEIVFPKRVVDNLDEFMSSIKTKIQEVESEMKKQEEAARQKRFEMYEQLKAEFGN